VVVFGMELLELFRLFIQELPIDPLQTDSDAHMDYKKDGSDDQKNLIGIPPQGSRGKEIPP